MPTFDIVSKIDTHELDNAIDQANREVTTRFDLKDAKASYKLEAEKLTLRAQSDFHIKQMQDILRNKLTKRAIDLKCLDFGDMETSLHEARQVVTIRQGIEGDVAKKIVKMIKDQKLKVQTAIQGDQVRVTGKKRDDLQTVISLLKEKDLSVPLQFVNFRD